jgi:hypothetical protein
MVHATRNGVSRTVLIYRPENFDAAVTDFANALGIADFGETIEPPGFGLRVAVSWATGLELIAPLGEEGFSGEAWDFLNTRGEGLFGLVWEVDELEAGEARAAAAGFPRKAERLDCLLANPVWRARFSVAMEAPLEPIAGVGVTLIRVEPRS